MSRKVPFISFIIPVYNAERYISDTLNSIIKQDDGDIEIICVDDGSQDSSGTLLDQAACEYPFITVIHQQNGGITVARNAGLQAASGEWICFVDNDDIVADKAVETIHATAEDDCDLVYYRFRRFSTRLPEQEVFRIGQTRYFIGDEVRKLQSDCINRFCDNHPLIGHDTQPTPWAKIYKRAFLEEHGLRFRDEVKHEEDIVFNFELLSYVTKAKDVDNTLYYYRWSTGSESHRFRPRIFEDVQHTLVAYEDIARNRYPDRPDIQELVAYRALWELAYCVYLGPMHTSNPASYRNRKRQFIRLLSYEPFAQAITTLNTLRFEPRQSLLLTLTKFKQFWLLNILGKIVGRLR